jgi:hypothetical protein
VTRHERIMRWIVLHFLANLRMAWLQSTSRTIKLVPWGKEARTIATLALAPRVRRWCPWLAHVETPDLHVPHPNGVAFVTSPEAVNRKLSGVVAAARFMGGPAFRNVKLVKKSIKSAYPPYDVRVLARRQLAVVSAVRVRAHALFQQLARNINWAAGRADPADKSVGAAEPVNLTLRINRLLAQLECNRRVTAESFQAKLTAVPPGEPRAPKRTAAPPPAPPAAGVPQQDVRAFVASCYDAAKGALSTATGEREPLLLRWALDRKAPHWKRNAARAFEAAVGASLKGLDDVRKRELMALAPAQLLAAADRVQLDRATKNDAGAPKWAVEFELNRERLPPPGMEQVRAREEPVAAKEAAPAKLDAPAGYLYTPKQPVVKTVPDVGFAIGHFQMPADVGAEMLIIALRRVLEPANLLALGVDKNTAVALLLASVKAAFQRQRGHFKGVGVTGSFAHLCDALEKAIKPDVLPNTIARVEKGGYGKALMLALFDWCRFVHPRHVGKLFAVSDGAGVNLAALPHKENKTGFSGRVRDPTEGIATANASAYTVVGLDCGRKGNVGVVAPQPIMAKVHTKAGAEGELARLQAERDVMQNQRAWAARELDAATVALRESEARVRGLEQAVAAAAAARAASKTKSSKEQHDKANEQLAAAMAEVQAAQMRIQNAEGTQASSGARLQALAVEIPVAERAVAEALVIEADARELMVGDRNKGVRCITKGQRSVEMHERQHRVERERRLLIFDKCLRGGATHHTLQKAVGSLHRTSGGANAVAAVRARQLPFWLLQVAHNSGSVRQQRRATDKLGRSYAARYTRVLTKTLPDAVAADPKGGFLQHNVAFPARSPASRERERVRGWLRGARTAVVRGTKAADPKAPVVHRGPVRVSIDACPTKGQRTTSTFPVAELTRSMRRLISRSPLREWVSVRIENGYRTSRQAAGMLSYLANLPRANHRAVKASDVDHAWQMAMVDAFGYFWCPVTRKIVRRDPPAALSVVCVGTGTLHGAPRFTNYCP